MEIEALDMASKQDVLKERKEKIADFFKKDKSWIAYVFLAILCWFAYRLRTLNTPGLRDITTGGWTLGPDLDPFLFLRWAEHIVNNGSLFAWDAMRYVPLGYDTKGELILLPYMIAWFHKIASWFGSSSIEQSAAIFPAFMFVLTVIAFFLLARKIFIDKLGKARANIIALLSSLFLTIIPSLLPRTIAGIPEKESVGFFFMFLAFYFFLFAWKAQKRWQNYSLSLLSGIATAGMALVWGGFAYIFVTMAIVILVSFLLGQVDYKRLLIFAVWAFSSILIMHPFSTRYSFLNIFTSATTALPFALLLMCAFHLFASSKFRKYYEYSFLKSIPHQIVSLIVISILGILAVLAVFGPGLIAENVDSVMNNLVTPVTSRLGVTVAENKQPYFDEWSNNFGPNVSGIPLFFWLFFFGSIALFYSMLSGFAKKERIIMTISYLIFLLCMVFSRYKPDSTLNGTNIVSRVVYPGLAFAVLLGVAGYYYFRDMKRGEHEKWKGLDLGYVLILALFFFSIVSARGAVRVIMVLVPPASIIASYFVVSLISRAKVEKEETAKLFIWLLALAVLASALYSASYFYQSSNALAKSYVPNEYTHQWQYAMSWVRENTPENSVFGHWWDYGYWVQSIGKRATVLDGGNAIEYWDYLMGRHGLTSPSAFDALEFLYSHNTTHFLIDSTDLGKYTAFSSIGSDENYDRESWISPFIRDRSQTKETKSGRIFLYTGGTVLDQDILYDLNGTKVFLPGKKAGIGAIMIEQENNSYKQPHGIYVYQNKQYDIPLRYAFANNTFVDYGSGIEAGVFLMPQLIQSGQGIAMDNDGVLLYLSNKTVKSQLARLYLYNEDSPYFKLVHSEDDLIVKRLKQDNFSQNDIIFFGGIRGPLRIWEINYPSGMKVNPEYLKTSYPNDALRRAG